MTIKHCSFAVAALGLASFVGFPAAAETVKVGVVLSLSGADSLPGQQIQRGMQLYLKENAKTLPAGAQVELLVRDDTGPNPDVAKRLTQELIAREHINLIVGALYTPNAMAMAPLATEAKIPFIVVNAATAAVTRQSPYIVRVSFTLWETAYPLGKWVAQQGGKKGYTAVSDYAPGYDAEAAFAKGFVEGGGTMIGSVRLPLGNSNYVPYLQRIQDARPDSLYVFVPVSEAPAMMRAVGGLNLAAAGVKLVSTMDLVPDQQLLTMGDVVKGLVTSGSYSAAGDRPQNKAFVAAWKRDYGADAVPDFTGVQGWDAMAAVFTVIKKNGGHFDGDQALAILKEWKNPDSPRGPIEIDPATRDIVQNIYIRRVEDVAGHLANVEFATIPQVKDPWKEFNPPK
jgi:branched-chain amino acid transport system substrate-binding protein